MQPPTGSIEAGTHLFPVRVYFEDTDAGGIAYHASFLRFMERGRTEFLRAYALHQSRLLGDPEPLGFVVRRMTIDFIMPARLDDALIVGTRPREVRGASLELAQEVRRDGDLLVTATVQVAAVRHGRAVRIPDELRSIFSKPGQT